MKVKTKDLAGKALDYAFCLAEGDILAAKNIQHPKQAIYYTRVSPSTNWWDIGPIIEREGIEILCNVTAREADNFIEGTHPDWFACLKTRKGSHWHGMTPMIAAAKCWVAACLGDEIDIPEELL